MAVAAIGSISRQIRSRWWLEVLEPLKMHSVLILSAALFASLWTPQLCSRMMQGAYYTFLRFNRSTCEFAGVGAPGVKIFHSNSRSCLVCFLENGWRMCAIPGARLNKAHSQCVHPTTHLVVIKKNHNVAVTATAKSSTPDLLLGFYGRFFLQLDQAVQQRQNEYCFFYSWTNSSLAQPNIPEATHKLVPVNERAFPHQA